MQNSHSLLLSSCLLLLFVVVVVLLIFHSKVGDGHGFYAVVLGLVIGSILVIMTFRSIPAGQADELRQDWAANALQLQSTVPGAREAAAIITDPASGPTQLAEARNSLISLDSSATALDRLVSKPFPTPPPL